MEHSQRSTPGYPGLAADDKAGRGGVVSFYMENLPDFVIPKSLWWLITRRWNIGGELRLRDVFIPRQRNKAGRRYAFVRFENVTDAVGLARKLSAFSIGASRISCNIMRYDRQNRRTQQPVNAPKPKAQEAKKSWKEVVAGVQLQKNHAVRESCAEGCVEGRLAEVAQKEEEGNIIELPVPAENQVWLSRCAVGVIKCIEEIPEVQDIVLDNGIICQTRFLGGGLVLLEFETVEELEIALKTKLNRLMQTFSTVRRWDSLKHNGKRFAWVQIAGIPIQAWCLESFQVIGDSLGGLVSVDQNTVNRVRLDVARLLVLIDSTGYINKDLWVRANGSTWQVRCFEEPMQGILSRVDWMVGGEDRRDGDSLEESCDHVEESKLDIELEEGEFLGSVLRAENSGKKDNEVRIDDECDAAGNVMSIDTCNFVNTEKGGK